MKIVTPVKLVHDLVEELTIDESGNALDTAWSRLILSEFDDHALEQAILLKERDESEVTVIAPDLEGAEDVLYAAAAKGADRLIKLTGVEEAGSNNLYLAHAFAAAINGLQPDIVLTGVQAHSDLDGQIGPMLAELLGLPYVGYVAGIELANGKALIRKEYPRGLIAKMEMSLPSVIGIQAAEKPPRYVAFSKVRQATKSATIEEQSLELAAGSGLAVGRMYEPESTEHAEMLDGDVEHAVTSLLAILSEQGISKIGESR
jgi:electron transfer flavoprotein beta subunit